jgi:hypothetical protein
MNDQRSPFRISRRIGRFRFDRAAVLLVILAALVLAGWRWIADHPQHNPFAPLDLRDPVGMATGAKLAGLRNDVDECRAVLERSQVAYTALEPAGDAACLRTDRTRLGDVPITPDTPPVTCPMAAGLQYWLATSVEPAAQELLGSSLARIEHLGAYSCRRIYGNPTSAWSEHATANAIDIAAFVLEDGTRISLIGDWNGDDEKALFLRRVRDGACGIFANVLSPDYNAAHADHFHLDQAQRRFGACR